MRLLFAVLAGFLLVGPGSAQGLGPEDVYLVVNRNVPESKEIGEYYCKKRQVPVEHIIELDLPQSEDISRADYDAKLAEPLRQKLKASQDKVKVLLTIYGVPLRVGGDQPDDSEKEDLKKIQKDLDPLKKQQKELDDQIKEITEELKTNKSEEKEKKLTELKKERDGVASRVRGLDGRRKWLSHQESTASVDSELALMWYPRYELRRWQINPLNFLVPEDIRKTLPPTLMTARLDGPDADLVKRMIDQAVEVEAKGLSGKVYVDARGIAFNTKGDTGTGYGGYDESLREMATLLEKEAKLPLILDNKGPLFPVGSCTDCALYCGWYSHANFVDCCKFVPGAVAYHIASSEARSLRRPGVKYWCKNLLEKGAIVTLGPVAEPYTVGFPKPAEFFGFLVTGELTVVECYWKTALLSSWMTTFVGDPLYNPYKKTPRLKLDQIKASPAGGVVPFGRRKRGG